MAKSKNALSQTLVQLSGAGQTNDWAKYVLDLPMADPPGEFFEYSNCASYMIAAILDKATQKNGLDFANEKLFSPLGIPASKVKWPINSQGVIHGFGGITLRPIDMAKFGFLYLHKGLWDGNQVISEEWFIHPLKNK